VVTGIGRIGGLAVLGQSSDGCDAVGCPESNLSALGATHLLRSRVQIEGRDYAITLELVRVGAAPEPYRLEESCEICGVEAVATAVEARVTAFSSILESTPAADGKIEIRTSPAGARVSIDGIVVGSTPIAIDFAPGEHAIEIQKLGYFPHHQRIEVHPGEPSELDLVLRAEPVDRVRPASWGVGWAALAVGTASVAASVPLFVLDGTAVSSNCSGNNIDVNGLCRYRHTTLEGGVTMAAVGASVATLGVALLIHSVRKLRRDPEGDRRSAAARLGSKW
jgi:hypothetical protein